MTIQIPTKALREKLPQNLQHILSSGSLLELEAVSQAAACLMPLLETLQWRGDSRDIAEALPHYADDLSVDDLRDTMARLGYGSRLLRTPLQQLGRQFAPCLYVRESGSPLVVVRIEGTDALVFDPGLRRTHYIPLAGERGTAYVFQRQEADAGPAAAQPVKTRWFAGLLGRYAKNWRSLFAASFGSNILALAVPLFTMTLYDSVIPSGSFSTLTMLAIGMVMLIAFEIGFLHLRGNITAYVGARTDFLISSGVFKKLLDLPPAQVEQVPLGNQIARLRDLHAVRSAITGSVLAALSDLPFAAVFLVAILFVGGWLVLIPIAAAVIYALAAVALHARFQARLRTAAQSGFDYQAFLVETSTKLEAIDTCGLGGVWSTRHREKSARVAADSYALSKLANLTEVFADVLKQAAGVLTLVFGTLAVLGNSLSVGALVASMALVWRALAPLQLLFLTAVKLEQGRNSIAALNGMMALEPERKHGSRGRSRKSFAGRVAFNHVSFRFAQDRDPSLIGVNFDVRPGELIALAGPSGAGKSTVLKLILGLYTPQFGSVLLDGLNVRQLDPVHLRQSIAYLPHSIKFFHGTVAQNLRLAQPTASDQDLTLATIEARVFDEIMALPRGFETWLDDEQLTHMPDSLRQRLALARLFVRKSSILLLDEPAQGLDSAGDQAFVDALLNRKGQSTIFVVTHRPDQMRIADRVFLLEKGSLRDGGSPQKAFPILTERRA
jgi:ATP-binding cassette subfamily C protein/ATP-binding cassette subfamily C protein LapB